MIIHGSGTAKKATYRARRTPGCRSSRRSYTFYSSIITDMAYHLTPMPQHIQITIWVGTAKQRDLIMKTAPSFYYRYKAQDPLESLFIPQNPMAGSHPAPREGLTLRDCKVELGGAKQTIVQLLWLSPSHQKHLIASAFSREVLKQGAGKGAYNSASVSPLRLSVSPMTIIGGLRKSSRACAALRNSGL